MNRKVYALSLLANVAVGALLIGVFVVPLQSAGRATDAESAVLGLIGFAVLVALSYWRSKDIGLPGPFTFFLLVPFANFFTLLFLLFSPTGSAKSKPTPTPPTPPTTSTT